MLMSVDTSLALWLVTLSVNISYCTDYLQSSQAYHERFQISNYLLLTLILGM
jgi:hypothetical protein